MGWKALDEPTAAEMRDLRNQFAQKARILVDESLGVGVASLLRERGFNAKYVAECGLTGHSDEDVFAAAWAERRVIFTHDSDFLDDRRFPHHRNPGVVVIRPGSEGNDNKGLLTCIEKTLLIAGDAAKWFLHRKLEFSSTEELKIRSHLGGRHTKARFLWPATGPALEWIDE